MVSRNEDVVRAGPLGDAVEIVDAQMHLLLKQPALYNQAPVRQVCGEANWPLEAAIAAMEAVGVSAALVDSNHSLARSDGSIVPDNSYSLNAARRYPGVFGPLALLDVTSPAINELVGDSHDEGFLGVRCYVRTAAEQAAFDEGAYDRFFSATQRIGMPVFCLMFRHLETARKVATMYPNLQLVVDHMGLAQPPWQLDIPTFKGLPELVSLADYDNIAIRLVGAPSYSSQPFPYPDIWEGLDPVVSAFGPERLMWGSDLTRLFGLYTYAELLGYLLYTSEISDTEKQQILGGSIRRILNWPRPATVPPSGGWTLKPGETTSWYEN
jgi:L-fuconolactonase